MKYFLYTTILFLFSFTAFTQNKCGTLYLGIQPSVTAEPYYDEGEFDINILPVSLGFPLNNFIDSKWNPVANLHLGDPMEFSHIGLEAALPVYFLDIGKTTSQKKWFAGPFCGYSYDLLRERGVISTGAEFGYTFLFDNCHELKLGFQEGATFFIGDSHDDGVMHHFGAKISYGIWF